MLPPLPPLGREEFLRRRDALRAEGKPLTLRNVDPEFTGWMDSRINSPRRALICLAVAAALLFVFFAALAKFS